MDNHPCLLDDATRGQIVSEMNGLQFADVPAAVKHFAYLVKSGKRFSFGDVAAALSAVSLGIEDVPTALDDLAGQQVLDFYPKNGTTAYFMLRGARIEYGESIGRPSRASRWSCLGAM